MNCAGGHYGRRIHLFDVSQNHRFVISVDFEGSWGGALVLSLPGPLDIFHATACPTSSLFRVFPFVFYIFLLLCCTSNLPPFTEPTTHPGLLTRRL